MALDCIDRVRESLLFATILSPGSCEGDCSMESMVVNWPIVVVFGLSMDQNYRRNKIKVSRHWLEVEGSH